jgi:uncharacterized membrane protein YesL
LSEKAGGGLFDPTNWFWRKVAQVGDLIGLSVCWLICSLPLFTAGAAAAALYDAVAHCVRRDERGTFVRFFRTFRDNFKPSLPTTLVFWGAEALLYLAYRLTWLMAQGGNRAASALVYADLLFLCVPLAVWLMGMAALSRFTFTGRELLKSAPALAFRHLPAAALVTAVVLLFALATHILLPLIALLPAAAALLATLPLERLFRRYEEQQGQTPTGENGLT